MKNFTTLILSVLLFLFASAATYGETGKFRDSEGNVREKPEAKAKLLFTSKADEAFSLLERLGDKWVKVQMQDGRSGWTSIINVKLDTPAADKPVTNKLESNPAAVVAPQPAPKSELPVQSQKLPQGQAQGSLQQENERLQQEIAQLEQEKMLIESSANQSQMQFEKLKAEFKELTAKKDALEAENKKLKEQNGK